MAWAQIGASLQDLASLLGEQHSLTASTKAVSTSIATVLELFNDETYLLWYSPAQKQVVIVLKQDCTAQDQLKAWAHALYLVRSFQENEREETPNTHLYSVKSTLSYLNSSSVWQKQLNALADAGWDIDAASLETTSGTRLRNHGSEISAPKS